KHRPIDGTWYKIVRRIGLPSGGFRNLNTGVSAGKSNFSKELKEMFFADYPINMDEAVMDGDDASTGDIWTHEARGAAQSFAINIGAQFYYGTSSDANGFSGLRAQTSGSVAAGTGSNSTTAYLIWEDPDWGCRFDVGRNGTIDLRPPQRQQIADPNNTGKN